jgi:hypothetical protein
MIYDARFGGINISLPARLTRDDQGTRVLGGRLIPTYIDDNKAHIFEENTTESSQS